MLRFNRCHHIAIICSDLEQSKCFYTAVLGFSILREIYRPDSDSYKVDLALNGTYMIELFSFPNPPKRVSRPEATGLRHIAFEVDNLEESLSFLDQAQIQSEPIRMDKATNKRFTFIFDPDDLPIELYEK
ncbi:MAG: VOC family protein [Sphingobacteriaceae bacterium]|jgi:glyoxylase I family protein|nr:MAG: VOC family protein [Pedobacter sp.]